MSLTSHLRSKESPVRVWLAQRLPNTRPLVFNANRRLCAQRKQPPIPRTPGADSGLVGTAVGYVLAATFDPRFLNGPTPALLGSISSGRDALTLAERAAAELPGLALEDRVHAALVLARFEQFFRSPYRDKAPKSKPRWEDVSETHVTEATVADLRGLAEAAIADHEWLADLDPVFGPVFGLSTALGGADADVVASGLLLDFKSSTKSCVSRDVLWQLVGYALADTEDFFDIERVGVSALRWRRRVVWALDELLAELSGEPVRVDEAREEFTSTLATAS